jgi:hypothetical protein
VKALPKVAILLVSAFLGGCSSCQNKKDPVLIEVRAFVVDGVSSDCPYSSFLGNGAVKLNFDVHDGNNKLLWSSGLVNTANPSNSYVIQVPDSGAFTIKAFALAPAPPSCYPCYAACGNSDGLPSYKGTVTFTGPATMGATYTVPMNFDVCTC